MHRFAIDFGPHLGIILVALSHKFHYFFDIDFCIDFLMPFWREIYEKGEPEFPVQAPFFATFSEGRSFDAFWSPIGSLLAPFWRPLVPFGRPYGTLWLPFGYLLLLLAPFGALLVPFASLLAPFWYHLAQFCSPQDSIFSLWATPASFYIIILYFP